MRSHGRGEGRGEPRRPQHIQVTAFPNRAVFGAGTLASLERTIRAEATRLCEVAAVSYGPEQTTCTLADRSVAEAVACALDRFPNATILEIAGRLGVGDAGAEGIILSSAPDPLLAPDLQNRVTFEYSYRGRADRYAVEEASTHCLRSLVRDLDVDYAYARTRREFDRKNRVDMEGGGRRVVGLELPDRLPGLYWANYWGRRYVDAVDLGVLERSALWKVDRTEAGGAFLFLTVDSDMAAEEAVVTELTRLAPALERAVAFPPLGAALSRVPRSADGESG